MPGGITWSVFGGVIAAGRVATILIIVFLVQAPQVAYAMFVPAFVVHCTFGAASGFISLYIVRAISDWRRDPEQDETHERV